MPKSVDSPPGRRDPVLETAAERLELKPVGLLRRLIRRSVKVFTKTTTALLDALKDHGNEPVWAAFDARYRPVVTAFARTLGFSEADAAEIAQQTLAEFVRSFQDGRYQRGKGRLSSWIIGIAQNIASGIRRSARVRAGAGGAGGGGGGGGDSVIAELPDHATMTQIWEQERQKSILDQAMHTLRTSSKIEEKTMRAFELVALRGVPPEAAAEECRMPVSEVYVAKNRVTKKLREIVAELTKAYEEDE